MAIWNRMLSRKSVSSSASSGGGDVSATTTNTSSPTSSHSHSPKSSTSNRLVKTFTWRSKASSKEESSSSSSHQQQRPQQQGQPTQATRPPSHQIEQKSQKPKQSKSQLLSPRISRTWVHPIDRPLTETNLRHQEILNAFTFKFGRRKTSAGGRTTYSNVSPTASRPGSLDASAYGYSSSPPPPSHAPHSPQHQAVDRRVSSLGPEPPREQAGE